MKGRDHHPYAPPPRHTVEERDRSSDRAIAQCLGQVARGRLRLAVEDGVAAAHVREHRVRVAVLSKTETCKERCVDEANHNKKSVFVFQRETQQRRADHNQEQIDMWFAKGE